MACPRCAALVAPEQEWCLACGDAARTRLAPTPSWRTPIALIALLVVISAIALILAFVALTRNDAPVTQTDAQGATTATATGG